MTADILHAATEALRFAREHLGPASERALSSPEAQALVISRVRAGASIEDASLWFVHREGRSDARVADEFVAYFLADLLAIARPALAPGLRRFLDSGDLVQSVLGDLWREVTSLNFESRPAFLAFLAQRLRWKAMDHNKALQRDRRREDRRIDARPEELALAGRERAPDSLVGARDEWDQLALRILRLPDRDRELVRLHLRGERMEGIATALGLQHEAARKALQRALTRLRDMR